MSQASVHVVGVWDDPLSKVKLTFLRTPEGGWEPVSARDRDTGEMRPMPPCFRPRQDIVEALHEQYALLLATELLETTAAAFTVIGPLPMMEPE